MAWHVNFWNHMNMALSRKLDNMPYIIASEKSSVRFVVVTPRPGFVRTRDSAGTPGTDFGQFRVFANLDPPPLIVGEMQMQTVKSVQGDQVNKATDLIHGEKVPRDIEVHSPPGEPRAVLDLG
jgi:hypothetical protein